MNIVFFNLTTKIIGVRTGAAEVAYATPELSLGLPQLANI